MTSPYTVTSDSVAGGTQPGDWERLAAESPALLASTRAWGAVRANMFAGSTHVVHHRLRQRFDGKALGAATLQRREGFRQGCSVCVDGRGERGFAIRDALGGEALVTALGEARSRIRGRHVTTPLSGNAPILLPDRWVISLEHMTDPPETISEPEALESARRIAEYCFAAVARARSVAVDIHQSTRRRLVVGFDGRRVRRLADERSRIVVVLQCTVDGVPSVRVVRGICDLDEDWPVVAGQDLAAEAARRLNVAPLTPSSEWQAPVWLAAGWCSGVWVHEVVGHQLEADNFRRGWSVFRGLEGEKVADSGLTVTDQPELQSPHGSDTLDDEGTPASCTHLLRDGRVAGILNDARIAERSGTVPSGNGRRQDYRFEPQPRIWNLAVERGPAETGDFAARYAQVLHVLDISSGHVDGRTGRFRFVVPEAELLVRGEQVRRLSGIAIEGDALTALNSISLLGGDVALEQGRGRCLKNRQLVDVGSLSPSILIEELTITPHRRPGRSVSS